MKPARWLHAAYIDLRLFLTGKRDPELPPLRLRDVGAGDFRAVGEEMRALLVRHGLSADDRVLDVGCGVGRVALPLTGFLSDRGSYEGFDIVPSWIRWCRRNVTARHPRFRFTLARIRNTHYRRSGATPETFRFPYDDSSFDFAFAISLFTHLGLDAARRYLAEVHRVLRPGGRLVATFFLHEGDEGRAAMDFAVDRGDYRLLSAEDPDWGIAFRRSLVDALFPSSLWPSVTVSRGQWHGDGTGETFQDVVVAVKVGA